MSSDECKDIVDIIVDETSLKQNTCEGVKCGEIFRIHAGLFMYCCCYCNDNFFKIDDLTSHTELHFADNEETIMSDLSEVAETPNVKVIANEDVQEQDQDFEDMAITSEPQDYMIEEDEFGNTVVEEQICEVTEIPNDADVTIIPAGKDIDDESSGEMFKCDDCFNSFESMKDLTEHQKDHKNDVRKCVECSMIFNYKSEYSKHLRMKHGIISKPPTPKKKKKYPCTICSKTFSSPKFLETHLQKHKSNTIKAKKVMLDLKCQYCNKVFAQKRFLEEHEQTHSKQCPHCPERFASKRPLLEHLRDIHGKKIQLLDLKCDLCEKEFVSVLGYKLHMQSHAMNEEMTRISCKYCEEFLPTAQDRIEHEKIHIANTPSKCLVCSEGFTNEDDLKQHMTFHRGVRHHKCPHCAATFAHGKNLTVHIRRCHSLENAFKCDHCEECFSTSVLKMLHMRDHVTERPYQCEKCVLSFPTRSSLEWHRHKHRPPKPQVCSICKETLSDFESLKTHMETTHPDAKAFECPICYAKFTRKIGLTMHLKIHEVDNENFVEYVCAVCDESFSESASLNRHLKTHVANPEMSAEISENAEEYNSLLDVLFDGPGSTDD